MPFRPGHSGNPNGRLKGSRNKATIAREAVKAAAATRVGSLLPPGVRLEEVDAYTVLRMSYQRTDLSFSQRLEAAAAALPYERPRLGAVMVADAKDAPAIARRLDIALTRLHAPVIEAVAGSLVVAGENEPAADAEHVTEKAAVS